MSTNTLTADAVVSLLKETAAEEISYAWWKKYGTRMPLLANVDARSVSSIAATFAPAERLFSRADLVMTSLRTAWGTRGWHRSSRLLPLKKRLDIDDLLLRDAAAPKAKKARVDPGVGAGAAASASSSSETAAVVVVDADDGDDDNEEGGVDSDIDSEPLSALVDSSPPPAFADDDAVQIAATTTATANARKPEMKFPFEKHYKGPGGAGS